MPISSRHSLCSPIGLRLLLFERFERRTFGLVGQTRKSLSHPSPKRSGCHAVGSAEIKKILRPLPPREKNCTVRSFSTSPVERAVLFKEHDLAGIAYPVCLPAIMA